MKVLVAYSHFSSYVGTTLEYLESFKMIKDSEVSYLNVTYKRDRGIDLSSFDVVILSYCARLLIPDYVSREFKSVSENFLE